MDCVKNILFYFTKEEKLMAGKIRFFVTVAVLALLIAGCPLPAQFSMRDYGFKVLTVCGFLPLSSPDVATVTVGNTTTYTYTNANYNTTSDLDAVVTGTIVETDDSVTVNDAISLSCANDDMGLTSITGTMTGPSGGDITGGTLYINGTAYPATEYQAYLDSFIP
jgi:hypothetical protein